MRLNVRDVALRQGIATAYELSKRTGVQVTSIYKIWSGEARMIGLDTLDKLCTVLNVMPGQLFDMLPPSPDLPPAPERSKNAPRRVRKARGAK